MLHVPLGISKGERYTGGIQQVYRFWGIQGYTGGPGTPTILNQGYTGGIQHKRYTGVYRFLAWARVACIQVGIQGIQPALCQREIHVMQRVLMPCHGVRMVGGVQISECKP